MTFAGLVAETKPIVAPILGEHLDLHAVSIWVLWKYGMAEHLPKPNV